MDYEPPEEHDPQDDECVCGHPRWQHTKSSEHYFCIHIDHDNVQHEVLSCECQGFKLAVLVAYDKEGVPHLPSEFIIVGNRTKSVECPNCRVYRSVDDDGYVETCKHCGDDEWNIFECETPTF